MKFRIPEEVLREKASELTAQMEKWATANDKLREYVIAKNDTHLYALCVDVVEGATDLIQALLL